MNRLIEEHDKKRKEELEKYAEELRDVQRREFLDLAAIAAMPTEMLASSNPYQTKKSQNRGCDSSS